MVSSLVDRATSDLLIGPDWAMNIEICDTLNRDPGQARDVVKGLKKRIGSRNSKVQLLALTLLETVVKNCGDIVHMHVAEKDVLREMVKIVKKKPDIRVKEKILILIDTWQEAFGGARARYPQYYAAYQELLRVGAVFPQRSERAPIFTPPQTQPLSSYPPNMRMPDHQPDEPESSGVADLAALSMTEIQNARGIMDVLSEMLNAIDPGNKEGLRQEVIVDLVDQCLTYKQRVVYLVNTTSDEELLSQGLTLNDDLQRVLSKHEAIASGAPITAQKPRTSVSIEKPNTLQALVDIDEVVGTKDNLWSSSSANSSSQPTQLLVPVPSSNGSVVPVSQLDPKIDLLSGETFGSSSAENSLALVPVGESQSSTTESQQNVLALSDMFALTNVSTDSSLSAVGNGQIYPQTSNFQPQQQQTFYLNGGNPPPYERTEHTTPWNGQVAHGLNQQQPHSDYGGGAQSNNGDALPPPPWEVQATADNQLVAMNPQPQPVQNGLYPQAMMNSQNHPDQNMIATANQQFQGGQTARMMPNQQFQGGQTTGMMSNQQFQGGQTIGMMPNQQFLGGQTTGMTPNQQFQGGQTTGMMPNQQFLGGQTTGMMPNQQFLGGQTTGMMPNQQFQGGQATGMMPNQQFQGGQTTGMMPNQQFQGGQTTGMMPQAMNGYGSQFTSINPQAMPSNHFGGYEHGQRPETQLYNQQRMYGVSMQNNNALRNSSYQMPSPSYMTPTRPSKPEDKLFGDLVDLTKFKPKTSNPSRSGSM